MITEKMKVYLDNCCFNRPYDDQTNIKVEVETKAKLYIQALIADGAVDLVWSYMLDFENSKNTHHQKAMAIQKWQDLSVLDVDEAVEIIEISKVIQSTGIKPADSLHIACAIYGDSDCFITVDNRLLKYKSDKIIICDPIEFLRIREVKHYDK